MWLVDAGWQAERGVVGQLHTLLGCCSFGMQLGCEGFARGAVDGWQLWVAGQLQTMVL